MPNLDQLPLIDEENLTSLGERSHRCVVESPRGAAVKWKYDPQLQVFVMGKALAKGLIYPFDWGFLPSTRGDDGDPLDVMIVHDGIASPGVIIPSQLIGVLEVRERRRGKARRNDRLFAVPVGAHRQDDLNHVDQLGQRLRQELEQFFVHIAVLAGRKLELLGWRGPNVALKLVDQGARRFAKEVA